MLPACRALKRYDEETSLLTELLNRSTQERICACRRVCMKSGDAHSSAAGFRSLRWRTSSGLLHWLTSQATRSLPFLSSEARQSYDHLGKTEEAFQAFTDGLMRADRMESGRNLRQEMLTRVGNIYLKNRQYAKRAFFQMLLLRRFGAGTNLLKVPLHSARALFLGEPVHTRSRMKNYRLALELFDSYGFHQGAAYALGVLHRFSFRGGTQRRWTSLPARLIASTSRAGESCRTTSPWSLRRSSGDSSRHAA